MSTSALARLVGDAPAFLRESFGTAPRHVTTASADAFDDVLSLAHVDELVAGSGLRAPAFRLVRDGVTLPTERVTRRVRIGSRPVHDLIDVAAVHAAFADGATIVLQGLHRSWRPVARLCHALERELTHPVQANAYLTPPVAQGLQVHADPHDVFAVQTHGGKRWVVHPPDGGEPWDLRLGPGDVLYLPAGTRHAAQTVDLPSLHLTIGVRTIGWADVARRAFEEALGAQELRSSLPAGWADDPGAHRRVLVGHLEKLADRLRSGGHAGPALRDVAADFWTGRDPDRTGGLRDLLELPALDDATPLRRRPELSLRLESRDPDRLVLVLADRRVTLPDELGPVLDRVLSGEAFLAEELDDLIDAPSRLVLCRRLVREGVLTIERPAGHRPRG